MEKDVRDTETAVAAAGTSTERPREEPSEQARTPEARRETELVRVRTHMPPRGPGRNPSFWRPPPLLAGRYRIEHHIASGTMGRVYAATQLPLDRPVAVKILRTSGAMGDPRFRMRFAREASIASQLAHPNIVSIYDYGQTEDGDLFMVMELLSGRSLFHLMSQEGPLSIERALRIAIQVTRALRRAHAEGVVHRDLKPANIMIATDQDGHDFAKVLDFGLVKIFAGDEAESESDSESDDPEDDPLTRTGCMVGTPEYVAPEQALGDPVDARADIYSLGVVLYQMIAGQLPFTGASVLEIVHHHFATPMPPIRERAPGVDCPPEVEAIIRRAVSKLKEDRFATSDELLGALHAAWQSLREESFGTEPSVSMSEIGRRRAFAVSPPVSVTEARIPEAAASSAERENDGASDDDPDSSASEDEAPAAGPGGRFTWRAKDPRISAALFAAALALAGVAYRVSDRRSPRVVIEPVEVAATATPAPAPAPKEAAAPARARVPQPAEAPKPKQGRVRRGPRYKINPY